MVNLAINAIRSDAKMPEELSLGCFTRFTNVFPPGMSGRPVSASSLTSLIGRAYMVLLFLNLLEQSFFTLTGNTPSNEMERVAHEIAVTVHL